MARKKESVDKSIETDINYVSPEAYNNEMVSLAMDLSRQRLKDGTASPSEITHWLRMGTKKYELELEMLKSQHKLTEAKTEAIENGEDIKQLYEDAISAIRRYQGEDTEDISGDAVI